MPKITKIIFISILLTSFKSHSEENLTCVLDNENFIAFYPFRGYWSIITDKPVQVVKRAENIQNQTATKYTSIESIPAGTKKRIWVSGALDNNLVMYIEPLCYY